MAEFRMSKWWEKRLSWKLGARWQQKTKNRRRAASVLKGKQEKNTLLCLLTHGGEKKLI